MESPASTQYLPASYHVTPRSQLPQPPPKPPPRQTSSRSPSSSTVPASQSPTRSLHSLIIPPIQPFHFTTLPLELQTLIISHHFNLQWSISIHYERKSILNSRVRVLDVPSFTILRVSRFLHALASQIRIRTFTGRLHLDSVFALVSIRRKANLFDWVMRHVRILHFSDSSVRPERWYRYYEAYTALERVEIAFPRVVEVGYEHAETPEVTGTDVVVNLGRVLAGERDDLLLRNVEPLRDGLIGELGKRLQVMVRQNYFLEWVSLDVAGRWSGILTVSILLSETDVKVLERNYKPNPPGGRAAGLVMSGMSYQPMS